MLWDNNEDIIRKDCAPNPRAIQKVLDQCRDLRTPYVIITSAMHEPETLQRVVVPVSMLEEETYKAEICTFIARHTHAHIILLQAHDFGSKAAQNTARIATHIRSVSERTGQPISFEILMAHKDSMKVNREAAERCTELAADLIILTASRDYGLDDILFGPQERHAIQRALVPVMLVNPREDLFSLCD